MSFLRFFLVRLAWALLGLWIAATLMFLVFFVWSSDPARRACGGDQASRQCVDLASEKLHLDSPLVEQYARYLWNLVAHQSPPGPAVYYRGEGGPGTSGELALQAVPATLSLVVPSLLLAAGVAVLVGGALARTRWRRTFDLPIYVAVGLSPVFLGLLLGVYVVYKWELAPAGGYCEFFNPPPGLPNPPPGLQDSETCGGAVDWATHLILPVITLSLYFAAVYTRVFRALAVQVRSEEDPDEQRKRRRRSSLLFARSFGRDFGFAIGVGMFVEAVFQIPGLGRATVTSVFADSFLELQAYVLYATFLAISVHFVVDVVVAALDPSLRWERPVARRPNPA